MKPSKHNPAEFSTIQVENISYGVNREIFADHLNKITPVLRGVKPQDELEGMLAARIVGVHLNQG
jgi:hypothetical protein